MIDAVGDLEIDAFFARQVEFEAVPVTGADEVRAPGQQTHVAERRPGAFRIDLVARFALARCVVARCALARCVSTAARKRMVKLARPGH